MVAVTQYEASVKRRGAAAIDYQGGRPAITGAPPVVRPMTSSTAPYAGKANERPSAIKVGEVRGRRVAVPSAAGFFVPQNAVSQVLTTPVRAYVRDKQRGIGPARVSPWLFNRIATYARGGGATLRAGRRGGRIRIARVSDLFR